MIQDLKELLGQVSTPGDTATVLLAGSVGFVVDAGLNAVGFLSPGVVGVTSASIALGLKKSWDAGRIARERQKGVNKAAKRASSLLRLLAEADRPPGRLVDGLRRELTLHELGIIDDEALDAVVRSTVDDWRRLKTRRRNHELEVVPPDQV